MEEKYQDPLPLVWTPLYEAARKLNTLKPWAWLIEQDIFGVQDPQTGEVGYCCVMGELEAVFGMAVYPGAEGFETYATLQSGNVDIHDPEVINLHRCLLVSFEDRDALDKKELYMLKKLGIKFRGPHMWPQFRSIQPGYVPWYLCDNEARFLTLVLEQACDVVQRFKNDPRLLIPPAAGMILVRVSTSKANNEGWKDDWQQLEEVVEEEYPPLIVDDLRIQRIKKQARMTKDVWEFGTFFAPIPVDEGSRPYFPLTLVVMDHGSGLALHTFLTHPEAFRTPFQNEILSFIEENARMPREIIVSATRDHHLIQPIATRLSIKVKPVPVLERVEDFRKHLYEAFL